MQNIEFKDIFLFSQVEMYVMSTTLEKRNVFILSIIEFYKSVHWLSLHRINCLCFVVCVYEHMRVHICMHDLVDVFLGPETRPLCMQYKVSTTWATSLCPRWNIVFFLFTKASVWSIHLCFPTSSSSSHDIMTFLVYFPNISVKTVVVVSSKCWKRLSLIHLIYFERNHTLQVLGH